MNWIKTILKESIELSSQRRKQFQFSGLLLIMGSYLLYLWFGFTPFFYGSLLVLVLALSVTIIFPFILFPILVIWFFIGKVLGEIISYPLIFLLYFLFIWVFKLFVKVDISPGWKPKKEESDYSSMG